jgi:hypothetical protein
MHSTWSPAHARDRGCASGSYSSKGSARGVAGPRQSARKDVRESARAPGSVPARSSAPRRPARQRDRNSLATRRARPRSPSEPAQLFPSEAAGRARPWKSSARWVGTWRAEATFGSRGNRRARLRGVAAAVGSVLRQRGRKPSTHNEEKNAVWARFRTRFAATAQPKRLNDCAAQGAWTR